MNHPLVGRPLVERVGEGRYRLEAVVVHLADGMCVTLGGGEKSHVGAVAISQPRPSLTGSGEASCTTSVFNVLAHKDDGLAVPLAERLCRRFGHTVVVTAGVHVEMADAEAIRLFSVLLESLGDRIERRIAARSPDRS